MADNNDLSERELEILKLLATGASNKEIGQRLYISANTVKVHLRNIYGKIEVTSRTEAAMYAVSNGLVDNLLPEVEPPAPDAAGLSREEEASTAQIFPQPQSVPQPKQRLLWAALFGLLALVAILVVILILRPDQPPPFSGLMPATPDPRWQSLAPLREPRYGLGAVYLENSIYALAGFTTDGPSGSVDRYDPSANTWETRAEKPLPVGDISAVEIGGKIYVPGGRLADDGVSDVLEIYDPAADRWQRGADLPAGRSAYALADLEGKLYLFGGWDGARYTSTVLQYDPERDAWQEMSPMPSARGYAAAVVLGGRILVIGGFDGENALDVNEVFSPATSESPWTSLAPLPSGRYAMGGASVADSIHIVGGRGEEGDPLYSFRYMPLEDQWQELESPLPEPRRDLGLVQLGTNLYLLGGRTEDEPVAEVNAYQVIYVVVLPIIR